MTDDDRVERLWQVLNRCEYAEGWNAWMQLTAVLRMLGEVDHGEPIAPRPEPKQRRRSRRKR